jgi:type I restriction enzyme M protein
LRTIPCNGLWTARTPRDKANLDIFRLRDKSLEDSAHLPEPDILAAEIAEDLRAALEQFEAIGEEQAE